MRFLLSVFTKFNKIKLYNFLKHRELSGKKILRKKGKTLAEENPNKKNIGSKKNKFKNY